MNVNAVLDALKKAQQSPSPDGLQKAFNVALGLVNYDLQAPALALYPWGQEITPLRFMIPRITSNRGDTATRWKVITGINTGNMPMGLSEGNRSGIIATSTASYTAAYIGLGVEDYTTFEADYAAEGFDDDRARMVEGLLRSWMIGEEKMIWGGNSSVALGTCPTPTGTGGATGGALSDATYYVGCVALTHDGYQRAAVAASGVVQTIVRTNADGTSDTINGGSSQPSAVSSGVVLNAGTAVQKVTAHVTPVVGAIAYAWYLGTATNHQYIQQITTINSVAFTTALVSASRQDMQTLTASDFSADASYSFDGLLYQTGFKSGSGSYLGTGATGTDGVGTLLTSDGAGGINEINTLFQYLWDNFKLSPDTMWVSGRGAINLNTLIVANGGAPLVRFAMDAASSMPMLTAGAIIGSIVNKVTNKSVVVRVHPNASNGTALFTSKTIPYPLSGVGNVVQMKCRREVYQTEWPLRTRKYEAGVYGDEVLQNFFPPAFAILTNYANL